MHKIRISYRGVVICFLAILAVVVGIATACAGPVNMDSKDYGILSGLVYSDDNGTGMYDNNEFGIRDAVVILHGLIDPIAPDDPLACYWGLGQTQLKPGEKEVLQISTLSDKHGLYRFRYLPAGTYSITEVTPYMFVEGKANAPGSLGGRAVTSNLYANIPVAAGDKGINYNFGEWGLRTRYMSKRHLIVVVPEPSIAVFAIGLIFMCAYLWRRRY